MHQERNRLAQRLIERFQRHPGRGGCGVGAVADLNGQASHGLVQMALSGLCSLEHRGGAIEETGDGAGLLMKTDPHFFARFIAPGKALPEGHHLSVGVFFFPVGEKGNLPHWQHAIDGLLRRHGLMPLGWRHVPVNEQVLGRQALASRRDVWQVLVGEGMVPVEDLALTFARVKALVEQEIRDIYVVSLSPHTLVYKAMATGEQLAGFYPDLSDPDLTTDVVVFHRRYSTNTFSNWYLAQVFRLIGHNGEINTIKANRNAVLNLKAELGLNGVLMPQGSDSADFDRVVDLFVSHGVSLPETVCRLMPMAWQDVPDLPAQVVRYFEAVQRAMGTLGAWEGPAAIVATDGRFLVASLDRMGLRPLRYTVTRSGRLIIGSEIGAIGVDFADVAETGQLDAGDTLALHLTTRELWRPRDLLERVVAKSPINLAELHDQKLIALAMGSMPTGEEAVKPEQTHLNVFGWSMERTRSVRYMAENGKEQITSMGYDRPLPAFSAMRPPLTKYFKQIVAVVTNPPIDPIREGGAFDLTVHLGTSPEAHEHRQVYKPLPQYRLESPFLSEAQFAAIRDAQDGGLPQVLRLDATFEDPGQGGGAGAKVITRRIAELCREAVVRVKSLDASILILSDRRALDGDRLPLPMVLVTSALHNALVEAGLRRHAGIVVETGEVQEGHDAAVLIANGATALFPYLFYQVGLPHGPVDKLVGALNEALKRIMSKMGICSVDGYRGSRLFEAVAIAPEVVEHYLPGITSRIGGIDLTDIHADILARKELGSTVQRDTTPAVYRKDVWTELQTTARGHDPESYGRFIRLIEETPPVYLRDLLELHSESEPLAMHDVASEEAIIAHCFRGAAMSHGALHRVAHRAIAAAFNHYGALSNCGEGGEDPRRDKGQIWETSRSRIRQVASGRFGVDARYLVHADELSIKIGQGAKPGEGGMLPAAKVTAEVAYIRRTQEGVALISPPPHHDIYSIEDLAQLIYNLRQVNPQARVSVKIPAVTDIGTIAVGIAKAGADIIDVSGFEGGTGAAASSSIEHAGLPLERALSETHQALVINGIRHLVKLRADGGIKTGFDVAAILALGADEVSLGTALMVAEQCIFCHGCANGMCPAGITTQNDLVARRLMTDKKGRAKDVELPDDEETRFEDAQHGVMRYLWALAHDLRGKMAALGLRHPKQLVGRVDLLQRKAVDNPRLAKVDLSEILLDLQEGVVPVARVGTGPLQLDPTSRLNERIVDDARAGRALSYAVASTDRAVGATLAGQMALGEVAVPPNGFNLELTGYVGQALGFACCDGMQIRLTGIANDQVGAAMGGGTLIVALPSELKGEGAWSSAGNAVAYGATGGRLFIEGRAGQRVGVRNSGATIVVEGAGKYAFEYMTGGIGLVLGPVGPVVGSGMTGGTLYLWGGDDRHLHPDVQVVPLEDDDARKVQNLLTSHLELTGSHRAQTLLTHWEQERSRFSKVVPKSVAVPPPVATPAGS